MIAILKIKQERRKKGLSQIQLAKMSHISQSYLSELENNKKSPTLRELCKIAESLNVNIEDLYYIDKK